MRATLARHYTPSATYGIFNASNEFGLLFNCVTLELPSLNNQKNISCIPEGKYKVVKHNSPKFGNCFYIKNVTGRDEILIHHGNYTKDTHGCILVGEYFDDINNDGIRDVVNSKKTMDKLNKMLADEFELTII